MIDPMTPPADRPARNQASSPTRPPLRLLGSVVLLPLLAACAGTPTRPDIPVAQEAAQYRAHARSYYAPPGPADDPWGPYIQEASNKFDVPDAWIRAVIGRESGGQQFRNGTLTTSPVGAMGLMQLMAPTYDDLRAQYSLGGDAFEPHDNIMAGTAYIRQMYEIYGAPGFLAAYNTGPGRLDDFLTRNRPLPRETRQYVAIIGPQIAGIWPRNRSQTDLLVASRTGSDVADPAAQSSGETRSVRMAWTSRRDLDQARDADQPVQVAEAPSSGGGAAPSYTRAWNSLPAARPMAAAPAEPVSAPATESVRAAWASRNVAPPAAEAPPVAVAEAAPEQDWTPAPTALQQAVVPVATAPQPAFHATRLAASAPSTPARHQRFMLIRSAMAEPAPLLRDAGRGGVRNWSVQVGAFGTEAQANQAAGAAQSHAPNLFHARAEIAGIRQGRGARIYRARLTGLSRGEALQACERLRGGRSECMVVSPDARS